MRFRAKELVLFAVGSLLSSAAYAVPWPIGVSTTVPSIQATFGQYRKILISDCPGGVACSHFQRGLSLDPTPTGAGTAVKAILAGTVRQINTGIPFISVTGTNGRVITYRYVTAAGGLNPGDSVTQLQTLGTMSESYVDAEGSYDSTSWCNPLYCLGSYFTNYYPVPTSVHPSIGAPSFIDANTFAPIAISSPIGNQQFHIIADITGAANAPSSPGVGVDQVGFYIEPVSIDTETYISGLSYKFGPWLRQTYDRVRFTSLLTPGTAYYLPDSVEGGPFYYIATNGVETPSLASNVFHDGLWQACVIAKGALENDFTTNCSQVTFDRNVNKPTFESGGASFTYATSTPIVTVSAYDKHGMYSITITGPSGSGTAYASGFQTLLSTTTGTLADGSYTATVVDLAGNSTSDNFLISTSSATLGCRNGRGDAVSCSNMDSANNAVGFYAHNVSSISAFQLFSAGGVLVGSSTLTSCLQSQNSNYGVSRLFFGLAPGVYTSSVTTCSGVSSSLQVTVTSTTPTLRLCLTDNSGTNCVGSNGSGGGSSVPYVKIYAPLNINPVISYFCPNMFGFAYDGVSCYDDGLNHIVARVNGTPGGSDASIVVVNATTSSVNGSVQAMGGFDGNIGLGGTFNVGLPGTSQDSASFRSPETSDSRWTVASGAASALVKLGGMAMSLFQMSAEALGAMYRRHLATVLSTVYSLHGSDAVFSSTGTINFTFSLSGAPAFSTSTAQIYRFSGTDWSSATVSDLQATYNTTTGIITATGTISMTGVYGLFFAAPDSTAPETTLTIQGSSYSFANTSFVSTYSFVVLTATDPVSNGWSSTVATSFYRVDDAAFAVYPASVPLALGPHVFQYYSVDWNGNSEAVKSSTFVVTAGTVFKAAASLTAGGRLLAGYLDYGHETDIQSRAENPYTVIVSSPDKTSLLKVSNVGSVMVAESVAEASLEVGSDSGATATLLRSGNASSTSTLQVALGYNGDIAASHGILSRHSTGSGGNELDFALWTPASGSTASLGNFRALSLETLSATGGSMHVVPVGQADVQLEVSNGSATGGGTIHRLEAIVTSSRELKSDIRYLEQRDERDATRDVLGLKHSRFRFKKLRGGQLIEEKNAPLERGLIFEETPESIRMGEQGVSVTDRLINTELALKDAIQRLEQLEKRWRDLQEKHR